MTQSNLNDATVALADAMVGSGPHPSPDDLMAFEEGRLSDAQADGIREHLSWCVECAETVLDLTSWPEMEEVPPKLTRSVAEEDEDWRAIVSQLPKTLPSSEADADLDELVPIPPPSPVDSGVGRWGVMHYLVAALSLAVIVLSFQVFRLSSPSPQTNVYVVDLEPVGVSVSRSGAEAAIALPDGMEWVVLLLVQEQLEEFESHTVELRGSRGALIWQTTGVVPAPEGGYSVAIPVDSLPDEPFDILVFGVEDGKRQPLEQYRTRIR